MLAGLKNIFKKRGTIAGDEGSADRIPDRIVVESESSAHSSSEQANANSFAASGRLIEYNLRYLVSQMPDNLRAQVERDISADARVKLPAALLSRKLQKGDLSVSFGTLKKMSPKNLFKDDESCDHKRVDLDIEETQRQLDGQAPSKFEVSDLNIPSAESQSPAQESNEEEGAITLGAFDLGDADSGSGQELEPELTDEPLVIPLNDIKDIFTSECQEQIENLSDGFGSMLHIPAEAARGFYENAEAAASWKDIWTWIVPTQPMTDFDFAEKIVVPMEYFIPRFMAWKDAGSSGGDSGHGISEVDNDLDDEFDIPDLMPDPMADDDQDEAQARLSSPDPDVEADEARISLEDESSSVQPAQHEDLSISLDDDDDSDLDVFSSSQNSEDIDDESQVVGRANDLELETSIPEDLDDDEQDLGNLFVSDEEELNEELHSKATAAKSSTVTEVPEASVSSPPRLEQEPEPEEDQIEEVFENVFESSSEADSLPSDVAADSQEITDAGDDLDDQDIFADTFANDDEDDDESGISMLASSKSTSDDAPSSATQDSDLLGVEIGSPRGRADSSVDSLPDFDSESGGHSSFVESFGLGPMDDDEEEMNSDDDQPLDQSQDQPSDFFADEQQEEIQETQDFSDTVQPEPEPVTMAEPEPVDFAEPEAAPETDFTFAASPEPDSELESEGVEASSDESVEAEVSQPAPSSLIDFGPDSDDEGDSLAGSDLGEFGSYSAGDELVAESSPSPTEIEAETQCAGLIDESDAYALELDSPAEQSTLGEEFFQDTPVGAAANSEDSAIEDLNPTPTPEPEESADQNGDSTEEQPVPVAVHAYKGRQSRKALNVELLKGLQSQSRNGSSHNPESETQTAALARMFLQPEKRFWTTDEIIQKAAMLEGVTGVVVSFEDGMLVGAQVDDRVDTTTIGEQIPQVVRQTAGLCQSRESSIPQSLALNYNDESVHIFHNDGLYLLAFLEAGDSVPVKQLKFVTQYLSRKLN